MGATLLLGSKSIFAKKFIVEVFVLWYYTFTSNLGHVYSNIFVLSAC